MLAALGIVKGKPVQPDARARDLLDKGAKTATAWATRSPTSRQRSCRTGCGTRIGAGSMSSRATRRSPPTPSTTSIRAPASSPTPTRRAPAWPSTWSTSAPSTRPPSSTRDGEFLSGGNSYKLNLPKDIPAALFWSVTVYDPITASGLDNGQPFPSLNTMDKPVSNADGSTDIYFGPKSPGDGKNWLRTLPDKGFFVILRLYGPTKAFFDQTWKPGDIEKTWRRPSVRIDASCRRCRARRASPRSTRSWSPAMRSSGPGLWSTCTIAGSPSRTCRSRCCPVQCRWHRSIG